MHIMSRMTQGHYLADLVTVLGSQDIVFWWRWSLI
jgi:NADH:ubiquinone oxidoreductase subunit D